MNRLPHDGESVINYSFTMQAGGKGSKGKLGCRYPRLTPPNPKNSPQCQTEAADGDLQVRIVGAVGADEPGSAVRQNLMNYGVIVDGVRVVEGQSTAVANILVEAKPGANRIMQYPGAAYALEPADLIILESLGGGVASGFVISQLEIRRDAIEQAIETADREGVEILLNPCQRAISCPISNLCWHIWS